MNLYCIICMELFSSSQDVYATNCGHMFHYTCLTQWLERSKTCPQCRHRCYDKHTQRIYFNIKTLDDGLDVGDLQQKLEDAESKVMALGREIEKITGDVQRQKCMEKKSKEAIAQLEKKIEQKNSLIISFNQQMHILKNENKIVEDLKKELRELKHQMELMGSVESILTSTAADVDKMLKDESNPKTLSLWVTTLKRELRICESKKTDLRNSLKEAKHDLRTERELRGTLEDKIAQLESDNYRLNEIVNKFNQQKENPTVHIDSLTQMSPISVAAKKLRLLDSTNSPTLTILEKVKKIEESDSPYFNIKQSGVGLAPLLKLGMKHRRAEDNQIQTGLVPISADDTTEYTIFKKPRLVVHNTKVQSTNLAFNGVGGSERRDDLSFSFRHKERKDRKPKSISSRLKSGKLKKIPSAGDLDRFLA